MNKHHLSFAARAMLATALAASAVSAFSATGFRVNPSQEAMIKVGMTQADVRQLIGRPSINEKFANEEGPTWTYDVDGGIEHAVFYVDFGADGKVASSSEVPLTDQ